MDEGSTLALPDGRFLGYASFGDPSGRPYLLVPGFSSSRWLAGWAFPGDFLRDRGIRLVAVDRPGYGLSSPHPGAGFPAWAEDASLLARHLGVERLSVLGVSMGSGPALALTALRPELVKSTAVLSGVPPAEPSESWTPAARTDALYWSLAKHAPGLLGWLCAFSARGAAAVGRGDADRLVERVARGLHKADRRVFRELLSSPGSHARAAFTADVRESCRQGGSAMAEDLANYLRPWGFDPAVVRPVDVWHGTDDPKVPVELVRCSVGPLPAYRLHTVPGGHFAPFRHAEEIFARLDKE